MKLNEDLFIKLTEQRLRKIIREELKVNPKIGDVVLLDDLLEKSKGFSSGIVVGKTRGIFHVKPYPELEEPGDKPVEISKGDIIFISDHDEEWINIYKGHLSRSERMKINDDLSNQGLDGNGRFQKKEHGMREASDVLNNHGLTIDETVSFWDFEARKRAEHEDSGTANFDIAFIKNPGDPWAPISIVNSMLVFSWHKLDFDKYECLVYLS